MSTTDAVMKKWFVVFCWLGFLVTFGAGLGMFAAPEMNAGMLGIVVPESGFNPYFVRMLAGVLIPVSLCYLFALYDPDASRSLIILSSTAVPEPGPHTRSQTARTRPGGRTRRLGPRRGRSRSGG